MKEFDLIVIGGGAAGFAACLKAEEFGARTLMVNNTAVGIGGTCVNEGCLPTKHLLYLGEVIRLIKSLSFKRISSSLTIDFPTIIEEKNNLIQRLKKEKYVKILEGLSHVTFIQGQARVVSADKIQVNGQTFQGSRFIIATGSSPPSRLLMEWMEWIT